jgi:histone deacetylase complex regulatory component SIN3
VQIEDEVCPFEGPGTGYTFIGTKQMYIFMRFVTAIYQRFLKAREYSEQILNNMEKGEEGRCQINIY